MADEIRDCDNCAFRYRGVVQSQCPCWGCRDYSEWESAGSASPAQENAAKVRMNIFDQVERHENCTVEILTNTVTGDVSIGWWENDI